MSESIFRHVMLGKGHECHAAPNAVYLSDKGLIALRKLAAIAASAHRPKMSATQQAITDALLEILGVTPATAKESK